MSAKEIADKVLTHRSDSPKIYYVFTAEELQEFIDQLCMEQRSACLEAYEDDWKSKSILTAPQPEGI